MIEVNEDVLAEKLAKKILNQLSHDTQLLTEGRRNNDTMDLLICSYIIGKDWTHQLDCLVKSMTILK